MSQWVLIFITRNFHRLLLLAGGLFFLVSGALLVAALSSSSVVQVEDDLSQYWRTTYDILVRPRGTRSPIEEAYNLVEANFLTGINGGISFTQYEAIRDIPGVVVAAPIAVLAYLPMEVDDTNLASPASPGVYAYETDLTINRRANIWQRSQQYYVYYGTVSKQAENRRISGLFVNPTGLNLGHQPVPFMLAAIDPEQEAGLVNLDQAVINGRYLTGYESLSIRETESPDGGVMIQVTGVPVLINRTPYVDFVSTIRIKKLDLPDEADDLEAIVSMGGTKYLDTLPVKSIQAEHTTTSSAAYAKLSESLLSGNKNTADFRSLDEYRRPGPRQYEVINPIFDHHGLALAVDPPAPWEGNSGQNQSISFSLKAIGSYDIARIPAPTDINRVPLETYFPPITTLKYDENGQPVQPTPVLPTLWPEYSVPSPPFMLTNMEAARVIAGENCISAIRVRVGGIDDLSNEAQQRIEAIATEIRRRTGLDVDIMVGSSPTQVLVKEPDLGYVEENWIQKGLVFDYRRKVQSGHLILLTSLFVIGVIFILDLTWMDILANRRLLALQKAFGWYDRERITQIIARVLIMGFFATGLGILSGLGLAAISGSNPPTVTMIAGIGTMSMGISFLGSLVPAWRSRDISPITHIREGREKPRRVTRRVINSLWRYAWLGLCRHWERTRLGVLAAALSSALLTLFLLVTIEQRGFLAGSLLGQYIAGNIAGYHYAIVGIGFGLTIISLGNSLLAGILARRGEIGVLKAVGWRTGEVSRLFLGEGLLLGLLGGITGCIIGLLVFLGLYHGISISALWIILSSILTTTLIGIIASIYPSRIAANVPPSEVLHFE
jgi:hypothetical protein